MCVCVKTWSKWDQFLVQIFSATIRNTFHLSELTKDLVNYLVLNQYYFMLAPSVCFRSILLIVALHPSQHTSSMAQLDKERSPDTFCPNHSSSNSSRPFITATVLSLVCIEIYEVETGLNNLPKALKHWPKSLQVYQQLGRVVIPIWRDSYKVKATAE